MPDIPIGEVEGIKPAVASALLDGGYATSCAVMETNDEGLSEVKGIGPAALEHIRSLLPFSAPDDDEPADEVEGDEAGDGAETPRPAPRPIPRPRPSASQERPAPPGCQWIRLRKGTRQITCEARIDRLAETRMIRIFEGVRYPMPRDAIFGVVDRWHPMIVREEIQEDYKSITLEDVDLARWKIARKDVGNFLAQAQAVIERYQDGPSAREILSKGAAAVLERYNALRTVHPDEIPEALAQVIDVELPEGCLPISVEEMAGMKNADALSDPETGKSFATKEDLIRYQAEQQRRRQIPDWMKRVLEENLNNAIIRVPAGEVV